MLSINSILVSKISSTGMLNSKGDEAMFCSCSIHSNQEPDYFNGAASLKIGIKHSFKQHDAPFVRALVARHHGHCNHCGSQIFRNALKCTGSNIQKQKHFPSIAHITMLSHTNDLLI